MGGGQKIEIPDFKQYKIDGIKQLEWTRDSLAQKGLKDPWLRNEVWRFQNYPGVGALAKLSFLRGFKWAAGAMVVTIIADKALGISASQEHGHGHH